MIGMAATDRLILSALVAIPPSPLVWKPAALNGHSTGAMSVMVMILRAETTVRKFADFE
jgi:hypothetical protein